MTNINNFSRMDAVQTPIIPKVGELIRSHPDTISLGQGVVFYPPPPQAIEAVTQFSVNQEYHKYQRVEGIAPLIAAIEKKLAKDNQIKITDKQAIVVTAGSNMAFMNALLAITSADSEIILQTPYYFNHEMAIAMANCRTVVVPTDSNYQLCPEKIAAAITEKTRAIVTISPNNPTGVVYSESALGQVNKLCGDRGIYHISDEAYEYFTYDGAQHISPASFAGSEEYTISLYSLSKTYGFAGWRIGYMVIPRHLLEAVKKIQDTILICPPVISQYAALGALQVGRNYCQQYLTEIAQVRQYMLDSWRSLDSLVKIVPSQGAFYFFVRVNKPIDDWELVKRLVTEYQIAVIPGSTFGMTEGCYLRVAYGALDKNTCIQGMERLVKGLKEILWNG